MENLFSDNYSDKYMKPLIYNMLRMKTPLFYLHLFHNCQITQNELILK